MSFRNILKKLYKLNLEKIFLKLKINHVISQVFAKNKPKKGKLFNENNSKTKVRDFDEPIRYIHVGYPKAASTALQQGFFGKHDQILHLGCGNFSEKKHFWDDHGYIDSDINIALEIEIRYRNQISYNPHKIKQVFDKYFGIAKSNKHIYAVGISNENICFNWHGGIDTTLKAKRLLDIFGKNTKIIIVCRQQKDMIESLYKETIRFGYAGHFDEYLKYLWQYQDRNFLYDFCFSKVYDLYAELFGEQNVFVKFFEEFRNDSESFLTELSETLLIDKKILSVKDQFNKQLSDKALSIKLELNKKCPHSFENGHMHPFDTHRFVPYYIQSIGDEKLENEHYVDYHLRQQLCDLSTKLEKTLDVQEIEVEWKSKYAKNIIEFFEESNKLFYKKTGLQELKKHNYLSL